MLIKIIMLHNTNKKIIYSMIFVAGKVLFMHTQNTDTKFGFLN